MRQRHPNVAWIDAIKFRNRVVHAYHGIDWSIVWDTATLDAPKLRRQVIEILDQEYPSGSTAPPEEPAT